MMRFGHVSVARKMSSLKPEMLLMPRSIGNTRRILKSKNNCLKRLNSTCRSRISNLHARSEEHTSELQSRGHLVCRPLLDNKNNASTPHRGVTLPEEAIADVLRPLNAR